METKPFSETLVNILQIAWYHIPKDSIFRSDCRENFRSRINSFTDSQQKKGEFIELQCGRREMQNMTADASVYNNPYKIRFILNAWMQHEKSIYEQVTTATL
jgi:hypothetical protein